MAKKKHKKIRAQFRKNRGDRTRPTDWTRQFERHGFENEDPVQAERTVRHDTYVFNLQPHMHVRGKHISYTAVFPDGTEKKLLSVPNYQFNWQMIYTPKEPIFLPK